MLVLNANKKHSVTITDTRNGNSLTYETSRCPKESAKTTLKTIRTMQNGKVIPKFTETYAMFMKTPAEKFSVTITQHYDFQFGSYVPSHIRACIINKQKQSREANRLELA